MTMSDPLPDPDALLVRVVPGSAGDRGCGFQIRTTAVTCPNGGEVLHESEPVSMSPRAAAVHGRRWIDQYRRAADRDRCRMLGWSWSAVSRAIRRQRAEEASRA
jgi:hypothetical protein